MDLILPATKAVKADAENTLNINWCVLQTNLVASGANESEIYIWDLNNFATPMTPGVKTQVSDLYLLNIEEQANKKYAHDWCWELIETYSIKAISRWGKAFWSLTGVAGNC